MSRPRSPHWDNADSPSRFRTACRHSGGTEAAVLARGRVEAFRFNDLGLLNRRDHHLRDTSSTPDFEAFVAQIYKNDLYFAPIIGIDCSWRIEDRDAVANCESRARSDLAFLSGRYRNGDPYRDGDTFTGRNLDRHIGWHRSEEIDSCSLCSLIGGQRQVGAMRQAHYTKLNVRCSVHRLAPSSAAAIRAINLQATSSLPCGGHDSTLSAVTR